jgi:hypothetical protein
MSRTTFICVNFGRCQAADNPREFTIAAPGACSVCGEPTVKAMSSGIGAKNWVATSALMLISIGIITSAIVWRRDLPSRNVSFVAGEGGSGQIGNPSTPPLGAALTLPAPNFSDYFYAIRKISGHFYLDEISVYNPTSAKPTVSVTEGILDLNAASAGFDSSATDATMNGLALDWSNRRLYWATSSAGAGGYNFKLYTANYANVSKTWNYQMVTGSTLSNIAFNTGTPKSNGSRGGAFPRASFYSGKYYAGGQDNNNLAVWNLDSTGKALNSSSVTDYHDFFHITQTFTGGDFVIRPKDGLLVTSTVIRNSNTILTQQIANGINSSGSSATMVSIDSQIPQLTNGAVQIAGAGGFARLYGLSSRGNLYRIDNYDTSMPVAVKLGSLPSSYSDLSEGISTSVMTPSISRDTMLPDSPYRSLQPP